MTFKMIFMRPQPGVDRSGDEWMEGLQDLGLQQSDARAPVQLRAITLGAAIEEAERLWKEVPVQRFIDPSGYWILDGDGEAVHQYERDEAKTPRSAEDAERAREFQRRFVEECFALLMPASAPASRTKLSDVDAPASGPKDDFVPPSEMTADPELRALIARHPIAADNRAVLRFIELLAGPDEDTVGELQRRWCGVAALLAHVARGGYRINVAAEGEPSGD